MIRAGALAVLLALALCAPAAAADRALAELIGYSPDGRYFAFEQYGVHDGSGAPYADITVIDLSADTAERLGHFARTGSEDDTLPPLRASVAADAAAMLQKLEIGEPARYVAMVGDGVAGADGYSLRFGVPGSGPVGEVFDDRLLQLEAFDTTDTTGCFEPEDHHARGFGLTVATTTDRQQVFSDDVNAPPAWRGCPQDYRIYAVVLPADGDITQAVALISVYTIGWEGADRSFIAVPVGR